MKSLSAQHINPALRRATHGKLERQTAFGWIIALAIFFGGAGGGVFLAGYVTNLLYDAPLSKAALLAGPLIAIACTACLFTDLGNKLRIQGLFLDFSRLSSSWISRGAWALLFFIVTGLAYALTLLGTFSSLPWAGSAGILGAIAAIFALLVLLYTGFLLGVVKSIPFWNNPLLPVLFITSGLGSGGAIMLLLAPFAGVGHAPLLETLTQTEMILILAQLIMLWAYMGVATHRDVASAESVRLIKTPMVLIVGLGLLLPLGLLINGLSGHMEATVSLDTAAAVIELIGAFLLRLSILNAGVHLRLTIQ